MILALALAMSLGAWAQGQLLTTITASSDFQSGSRTFDGVATVTLDGNFYGNNAWDGNGTITVTPAGGATITSVKFISNSSTVEDTQAPFEAVQAYNSNLSRTQFNVDGTIGNYAVSTIEVYGTASPTVTRTNDNTWKFAMPGYNTALGIEYKDYPQLAWTLGGSAMPNDTTINLYRGFDADFFASLDLTTSQAFATSHSGAATAQLNIPGTWSSDNTPLTASDMPGFVAVTDEQALGCPDQSGEVVLVYGFDGTEAMIIVYDNGTQIDAGQLEYPRNLILANSANSGTKYYYTAAPIRFYSTNTSVVTIDAEGHAQDDERGC